VTHILVTGGAGYIGSVLVPKLLNLNYKVTVIDNFMYKQQSLAHVIRNSNLKIIYGDVRDTNLMLENLSQADVILPLAAIVGAPACAKDPVTATSINKDSVLWLLELLSDSQQIVMPTTNSAYGSGDIDNLCDELSPLSPLSQYAKEKVLIEEVLMQKRNATSLRLATVFGVSPRMRLDLTINILCYHAFKFNKVTIFGGKQWRPYLHIKDMVNFYLHCLKQKKMRQKL